MMVMDVLSSDTAVQAFPSTHHQHAHTHTHTHTNTFTYATDPKRSALIGQFCGPGELCPLVQTWVKQWVAKSVGEV